MTQPPLRPQTQGPSFSRHRAVTGTALESPPDTQPALGTGPVAAAVGREAVSPGMRSPALGCHGGPTDPGCPCPQRGRAAAPGPSQAKSHPCLCRGAGGAGPWRRGRGDPADAVPSSLRSVEHDFRQQEGRFQRVLSHMEPHAAPGSPAAAPGSPAVAVPPRLDLSPVAKPPAKLDAKKSRRKCFWFL